LDLNPVVKAGYRQSRCRKCFNDRFNGRYKDKVREYGLKRDFGISVEDYNSLLNLQGGVCAICEREQVDKSLAVDHDHVTGEVRGLLCQRCNQAIGLLREDQKIFVSAYEYLNRTRWNVGLDLVPIGKKA